VRLATPSVRPPARELLLTYYLRVLGPDHPQPCPSASTSPTAQTVLPINACAWPATVLFAVVLLLEMPFVSTAAWIPFLKLVGCPKTERLRLGVAAAKRNLNVRWDQTRRRRSSTAVPLLGC
jgi:hypothetical protein